MKLHYGLKQVNKRGGATGFLSSEIEVVTISCFRANCHEPAYLTDEMNMNRRLIDRRAALCAALSFSGIALLTTVEAVAADAAAAQALARQNNCFKCHAVDKKKEGPAWKEIAVKYKGNKDAEARLYKHLTSGEKAKFEDGHEEDHPIIKAKSPDDTKNLVSWILTLQ
jgi:cytochrome c